MSLVKIKNHNRKLIGFKNQINLNKMPKNSLTKTKMKIKIYQKSLKQQIRNKSL